MTSMKIFFAFAFMGIVSMQSVNAQSYENAGEYMDYIGKQNATLTAIYLSYVSAVAHNKSARKVEKRRQEVLNAITDTRINIQSMPAWKGDKSYRDSTVSYLKLVNIVFNEDYGKILNMEEIAEQSYDAMEAYLLAQEKAQEKLQAAIDHQNQVEKTFATKNNINLIQDETELGKKSKLASSLNTYYNQVYLIFFKAFKQEGYLTEAINAKNIVAIEQNKNSLDKFSEEGMEKLKKMKPFENDPSLLNACRQALLFFKSEALQTGTITDFFIKEENFSKLKKNFETKSGSQRSQKDVDEYNKAVADINQAVNKYNSTNKDINKQRAAAIDEWNKTVNKFMDYYMPVQKKVQ